jgi:hypothetical protein
MYSFDRKKKMSKEKLWMLLQVIHAVLVKG